MEYEDSSDRLFRFHRLPSSGSLPEPDTGLEQGMDPHVQTEILVSVRDREESSSHIEQELPPLTTTNRAKPFFPKQGSSGRKARAKKNTTKQEPQEEEILPKLPSDEVSNEALLSQPSAIDTYSSEYDWEFATRGRHMDITAHLLDEIALEGLDGITLQGLFERLNHRKQLDNMLIDDLTKEYLWNYAKKLKCVRIYLLAEARPELRVYNRLDFTDDRGILYEPTDAPEDIYEYFPIDDKKLGIRGSCKEYYKRTPFKSTARKMSYQETQTNPRYRNKVVLMAPQYIRERAIIPSHIDLANEDLNVIQYCILERVARAREQGEITRGKVSLTVMKIDAKSLFYQRKLLLKKGILKKQPLNMKYGPQRNAAGVTLLHIPRFYTFLETASIKAARGVIQKIIESPSRMCETSALKLIYGKHMVRALLSQEYSMIFEQQDQTYASLDPGALLMEPNADTRDMMVRRKVKVLTLKHPQLDHTNFMQLLPVGEEREEEEPEQKAIFSEFCYPWNASVLVNFIRLVYESRAGGISINELAAAHNISSLDARTGCRLLQRLKLVVSVLEDKKKTKLNKYVFVKFQGANRVAQIVDVSKALPGSALNPLVIENQSELDQVISSAVAHITPAGIDPDIVIIPDHSQPGKRMYQSQRTRKAQVIKPPPKKIRRIMNTGLPIPSGLQSATPLRLNPDLVELARTFVLDPKEDDIIGPPRPLDLRFNEGEGHDFRSCSGDTLCYETAGGFEVSLEQAELNIKPSKNAVIFNTERSVSRGNVILELIFKHRVVLGFQQILKEVRRVETKAFWEYRNPILTKDKPEDVDRRSLFRVLKQLQVDELIKIWRVTVTKQKIRKIAAVFTPFPVIYDCKLMTSVTDLFIQALLCRVKLTREQKRAKRKKDQLGTSKVPNKGNTLGKLDVKVSKTGEKAKRGTRRGTQLTPNLDRFVSLATTGTLPRRRRKREGHIIGFKRERLLYDEKDKLALANLTRRRVDWDDEEDCHLLCLFIASVLFIPRYNTNRIFMFNAPQIRDILHSKLPISKSKTTLAVRRRLHYLMRSDSFYCRYRYYLSEALNDEMLMQNYVSSYQKRTGDKIFYEIPTPVLSEAFNFLLNKFQTLQTTDGTDLLYFNHGTSPNQNAQKVCIISDEKVSPKTETRRKPSNRTKKGKATRARVPSQLTQRTNGIRIVSENTGIHTTIINAATNPSTLYSLDMWLCRTALLSLIQSGDLTHQIQAFMECLPSNILDLCVNNLKKIGIMAWNKPTQKFGITVPLKKRLNADISPAKYREGYHCVSAVRSHAGRPIMFDSLEFENLGSFIMLCELGLKSLVEFVIELPDPIITVNEEWNEIFAGICDSSSDDEEEERSALESFANNTYKNWKIDKKTKEVRSPPRRSSRISSLTPIPTASEDSNNKRQTPEDKETPEQSQPQSKSNISSVLNNVVSGQAAMQNALQSRSTMANPAKTLRMSNKALRLIRSQINCNESAAIVERDFFTVNIPKISVWFPGGTEFDQALYGGRRPTADIPYLENHLIKVVPYDSYSVSLKERKPTSDSVTFGRFTVMYNLIHASGPLGLSVVYLLTKFTRESVREGLKHMVHNNSIFLVGITYRKYVSCAHVAKWTMPVPKDNGASTAGAAAVRVVMRPWIRSNGALNWLHLDQCFVSILGHMKTLPCLSIRELGNHLRPMLSPVETMLLLEAMVHLDLIRLFKLERNHEVSLFSTPTKLTNNYGVDASLDMEFLHVELRPLVTVKYAELQEQLQQASGSPEVENIEEYPVVRKLDRDMGNGNEIFV